MKLHRETKRDKIVREIISNISSGAYSRDGFIPSERALCLQYNVNRGTLRKALSILKKLNILEINPRSKSYIQKFNIKNVPEMYLPAGFKNVALPDIVEARKTIELPAIVIACKRITGQELLKLGSLFKEMKENKTDLFSFIESDMNFHYTIIKATHNAVLLKAYEAIDIYHKYSQILTSSKKYEFEGTVKTHGKILEAVKKRDAVLCKKIMIKHFERMENF